MRTPLRLRSEGGKVTALTALIALVASLLSAVALMGVTAGSASAKGRLSSATSPEERLAIIRAMNPTHYERRVQKWINVRRSNHGLRPVHLNSCADGIAKTWGDHLASNEAFYHQELGKFFSRCDALYAGEALARGAISPRHMVRLWMESEGHRNIVLSRHPNRVGIGAAQDARGDWVVAADFIKR